MSSETIIDEQAFRDSEPVTGEKQFLIDRAIESLEKHCNLEVHLPKDYRPLSEIYKETSVYGRDASKDTWYDNHHRYDNHR